VRLVKAPQQQLQQRPSLSSLLQQRQRRRDAKHNKRPRGHEGSPIAHEARSSSGAAIIARGAQTVWPSPPVHRPSGTRLSDRLAFSACPSSIRHSPVCRLSDVSGDVTRTCDSLATHLRLNTHLRLTCDSLLPALSKVVITASDESRARLPPTYIVATYKSKHTLTTVSLYQGPLTTAPKHKGIDYSLHPRQHQSTPSQPTVP